MPVQRVVPDGRMEIVIHMGEPFSHAKGDAMERQGRVMISGQLTRAIVLRPSRGGSVFGIRFKPAGGKAVLRLPMAELRDELRPLDDVSRVLNRDLMDAAERAAGGGLRRDRRSMTLRVFWRGMQVAVRSRRCWMPRSPAF